VSKSGGIAGKYLLDNVEVVNNEGRYSSGIIFYSATEAEIKDSLFENNHVQPLATSTAPDESYAALSLTKGDYVLTDTIIKNNTHNYTDYSIYSTGVFIGDLADVFWESTKPGASALTGNQHFGLFFDKKAWFESDGVDFGTSKNGDDNDSGDVGSYCTGCASPKTGKTYRLDDGVDVLCHGTYCSLDLKVSDDDPSNDMFECAVGAKTTETQHLQNVVGNIFKADRHSTIEEIEFYLGLNVPCDFWFFIMERTSVPTATSTWETVWDSRKSAITSVPSVGALQYPHPVGYAVTPGNYYLVASTVICPWSSNVWKTSYFSGRKVGVNPGFGTYEGVVSSPWPTSPPGLIKGSSPTLSNHKVSTANHGYYMNFVLSDMKTSSTATCIP
jgi:hypothetical protein